MMGTQAYILDLRPTGSIYFPTLTKNYSIRRDIFTQSYPFSTSAFSHSRQNKYNSICDPMYPCLIPQTMRSELYDNVDIRVEIEVDDVSRYVCMYNVDLKRRG